MNRKEFSFPEFVGSDPNEPGWSGTAITRLEATAPLFTGGELSGRIAQARSAAEAAGSQASWAADNAALAAGEAWVMLAQAEEFVGLLTKSRDTVKAHVELAKSYVEQGMLVRSELLRAEVELARVEDMLEDAKGKARVANANLAFRIGVPQDSTWQLAPLPEPKPLDGDAAAWVSSAASRKDLSAARSLLRAGELEEKVKKAAWLPKVGVSARWDLHDKNLFGASGSAGTVMAFASVNLFQGGADKAAARRRPRGRPRRPRGRRPLRRRRRPRGEAGLRGGRDRPRPPRDRRQGARLGPRERADHRRALPRAAS